MLRALVLSRGVGMMLLILLLFNSLIEKKSKRDRMKQGRSLDHRRQSAPMIAT